MTKPTFDMEAALQALRDGKDLNSKDGILTPLIKQQTEAAMQAELEQHLAGDESPNRNALGITPIAAMLLSILVSRPYMARMMATPQWTHKTSINLAMRSVPLVKAISSM